jgi:hypothetical protein
MYLSSKIIALLILAFLVGCGSKSTNQTSSISSSKSSVSSSQASSLATSTTALTLSEVVDKSEAPNFLAGQDWIT